MNYEDYIKNIEIENATLNQKREVAIILIFCIRLAPLYSKFSEVDSWAMNRY